MNKALSNNDHTRSTWLVIFCLVIAGEMIFSLPFHVARYFRPTVLDVFSLSNAALGDIFAVYGVMAMLVYFPGGAIADRFSARKLMTVSLLATAVGGFYMAQIPGRIGLSFLFAYWGITTILFFWAALIRATREWGGPLAQGRTFGFLDGGRGLVAAGVATLAVLLFSAVLPSELGDATDLQRSQALQMVIYLYTVMTLGAAVLVWFLLPDLPRSNFQPTSHSLIGVRQVLSQRVVWLQSVIVVCAYSGYRGLDNYALYAVEVLGMNEVDSARFTSIAAFLRPVAAITAGFVADRLIASKVIGTAFLLLVLSYAMLSFLSPAKLVTNIIYGNLIVTFIAVFGIRGVYFALLEETHVAKNLTGTAVGLISLIGFTPDIFFAPIAGRLLDAAPGVAGHHHYFMLLTIISAVGMVATVSLAYSNKQT